MLVATKAIRSVAHTVSFSRLSIANVALSIYSISLLVVVLLGLELTLFLLLLLLDFVL